MDYVVLARKLRPARFQQLIGQDLVVRALRNAVLSDRVAHAFLFAGARGVGKTTTARILTKSLNCERPADGEPCNECATCQEITRNTSPDVYEIDAASNRGIDNIRDLRENTKYAPLKCRYKTYIIDEAHMLTMESFNALLKTLEEPPPHVKFILATTNAHRIPETVVSRCQRYDFARIPLAVMTEYLAEVTAAEGITLSRTALEAIARNASGSVRDGLTAVDQVVSYAGTEVGDEQVLNLLGLMDNREVYTLLGAIVEKSLPAALETFAGILERGHDLATTLEAILREIKDFSLWVALEGRATHFADHPPDALAFYQAHQDAVTLDELQQLFYVLLEVEEQIKRSEFPQACFEMGLVKACRVQPLVGISDLLSRARELARTGSARDAGRAASPIDREPPPDSRPSRPSAMGAPPGGQPGAARPARRSTAPRHGEGDGAEDSTDGEAGAAIPDIPEQGAAAGPSQPRAGDATQSEAASTAPADPAQEDAAPAPAPAPAPDGTADAAPGAQAAAGEPALCDDSRWRALVERAGSRHRHLAAKLRRAEVAEIAEDALTVIPADAAAGFSQDELELLAPLLQETFSPAFRIQLDDDTTKKARFAHTIAGRNRLAEESRLAAKKGAAESDEAVQRLLRFFPKGKIVDIAVNEAPNSDRSDDV